MKKRFAYTAFLAAILSVSLFALSEAEYATSSGSIDTSANWTVNQGTWWLADGEYHASAGAQTSAISTVNGANYTDCIVLTKLRFTGSAGYRAGIIFRYIDNEHYYSFEIGDKFDEIDLIKYSPANSSYGESKTSITPSFKNSSIVINANVNYTLRLEAVGPGFTAYLDNQKVLSWTDYSYTSGLVGLRARNADVTFDNFAVDEHSLPGSITNPTPTAAPTANPTATPTSPSTSTATQNPTTQPTTSPTATPKSSSAPTIPEFTFLVVLALVIFTGLIGTLTVRKSRHSQLGTAKH